MATEQETSEILKEKIEEAKEKELLQNIERASGRMLDKESKHYASVKRGQETNAEALIGGDTNKPEELLKRIKSGGLSFSGYVDGQYSATLNKALNTLKELERPASVKDIKDGIYNRLNFEIRIEGGVPIAERLSKLDEKTLKKIEGTPFNREDELAKLCNKPKQELLQEIASLEKKDLKDMLPGDKAQFLRLASNIGILDRVSAPINQNGDNLSEIPERFGGKVKTAVESFLQKASAGDFGQLSLVMRDINKLAKSGFVPESTLKAVVENYVRLANNKEVQKDINVAFIGRGRDPKEHTSEALTVAEYNFGTIYEDAYNAVRAEILTEDELKEIIKRVRS